MKKKNEQKSQRPEKDEQQAATFNSVRAYRELIESLAIALILALFFKAFVAEAFVIPTGSMATTLMGRHKDVNCEQCGFPFQVGSNEEFPDFSQQRRHSDDDSDVTAMVFAGTCPQCQYTNYFGPVGKSKSPKQPSFSGDRLFVNKGHFDFFEPQRWRVTVFRYPGQPQTNYIKRLVGLENETIRITNGDIFVKKDNETEFKIQRKPLRALLAMLRPVDDNDYNRPDLIKLGWPSRWFNENDDAGNLWVPSQDFRTFTLNSDKVFADSVSWLKFRNVIPASDDWRSLSAKAIPYDSPCVNPQLVTDFVGYNSGLVFLPSKEYAIRQMIVPREIAVDGTPKTEYFCYRNFDAIGRNWVGDLAVAASVDIRSSEGTLHLRLMKGGVTFLCTIDAATGKATLQIPDVAEFTPCTVETPVRGGNRYDILFCNIDEEMRLVVDGKEISFGDLARYDRLCEKGGVIPRDRSPTVLDLTPAAVGSQNATIIVSHLRVLRDIYYIASNEKIRFNDNCDLINSPFAELWNDEYSTAAILTNPAYFSTFGKTRHVDFHLGKDQFFMLGDNTAKSKDGRLWTPDGIPHGVDRHLLIGEALFVFWPHGWPIFGHSLPFIPNTQKMRPVD